jgi:hypothetical protein
MPELLPLAPPCVLVAALLLAPLAGLNRRRAREDPLRSFSLGAVRPVQMP